MTELVINPANKAMVWTNHHIALKWDFIFGVQVNAEGGFVPWDEGSPEEQAHVRALVLRDRSHLPDKMAEVIFAERA